LEVLEKTRDKKHRVEAVTSAMNKKVTKSEEVFHNSHLPSSGEEAGR
jgi:hypothetical protein